jgi:hypothetical protein
MPIIKAEDLAKGAHFVLPAAGDACVIRLMRTNGATATVSAAEVDRLLDDHEELDQLRARLAEYEAHGPLVNIGAESLILVGTDQVGGIMDLNAPHLGEPPVQSVVFLAGDRMGLTSVVHWSELATRVATVRQQHAERGR